MRWINHLRQSLKARLLATSGVVLLVFLGLTAVILDRAFTQSVIASAEEGRSAWLQVALGGVLAVNNYDRTFESGYFVTARMNDDRFNLITSDVFALILNDKGEPLWRSESGVNVGYIDALKLDETEGGAVTHFEMDIKKGHYFVSRQQVNWIVDGGDDKGYILDFLIVQKSSAVMAELNGFRRTLYQGLIFAGITLLAILLWLLIGSLKPLRKVAAELKLIQRGSRDQLLAHYPKELRVLTENINDLLENEQNQRERYRTKLGDLAHSLKTPLAVMQGMAMDARLPEEVQTQVSDQVQRMDQVIRYQLQRAVSEQQAIALKQRIELLPTAKKIARIIDQAWTDKHIDWQWRGDDIKVRLIEDDLMEVLGNIIENAAKYGRGKILIETGRSDKRQCFCVSDNGPGIAKESRDKVLKRGVRMDTMSTGQGIGLAVVDDILHSYRVELSITNSEELGGAKFCLWFP